MILTFQFIILFPKFMKYTIFFINVLNSLYMYEDIYILLIYAENNKQYEI